MVRVLFREAMGSYSKQSSVKLEDELKSSRALVFGKTARGKFSFRERRNTRLLPRGRRMRRPAATPIGAGAPYTKWPYRKILRACSRVTCAAGGIRRDVHSRESRVDGLGQKDPTRSARRHVASVFSRKGPSHIPARELINRANPVLVLLRVLLGLKRARRYCFAHPCPARTTL